jgi:hypothetical protein
MAFNPFMVDTTGQGPQTSKQLLLQALLGSQPAAGQTGPGLSGNPGAGIGVSSGSTNPMDAASNGGINPGGASVGSTTQAPKATGPVSGGFTPTGNIPGQITPTTAQAQDASAGGLGAARNPNAPAATTAGLDPNNPIDAIFLKTGYGDRGVGSGFGDLSYWRQHPDQASRLLADQQGTGTDTPGPADSGNTSHGSGSASSANSINGGLDLNPLWGSAATGVAGALSGLGNGATNTGSFLAQLLAKLNPQATTGQGA